MWKGEYKWDVGGEGAGGKDGGYWHRKFSVVDVGKEGDHLHNTLHAVVPVGEGACLDKVEVVVMRKGLNVLIDLILLPVKGG